MSERLDPSDLAALATLDALLEHTSVTRAAAAVGLSVPAVSHALARLRERFDDPLLVRSGRHMVPTPRALALRPQVREAMETARQVFAPQTAFDPATARRSFTVGATDYVAALFGPPLLATLPARAPHVQLRLVPNTVDDADRIRQQQLDLAIGIYGTLPPETRMRRLLTDRFVVVCRQGHPAGRSGLSLDDYVAHAHIQIAPRGMPGGYIDQLLADRGLQRHVAVALPWFRDAVALAAASDLLLTVSERLAALLVDASEVEVHPLPFSSEPYALSLIWHPAWDNDPGHRWLREQWTDAAARIEQTPWPQARRWLDPDDPTTGRRPARRRNER